ncbi:hypothetical protein A2U01_0028111 [Trifolium medium]|uniref:Uncharacterized protein n=1 Tax=Trifolium medium TaxID=97028 RepID=A0A392P4T4_9FABA|nr:hypothetical protein [Trifolium medium]
MVSFARFMTSGNKKNHNGHNKHSFRRSLYPHTPDYFPPSSSFFSINTDLQKQIHRSLSTFTPTTPPPKQFQISLTIALPPDISGSYSPPPESNCDHVLNRETTARGCIDDNSEVHVGDNRGRENNLRVYSR